MLYIGLVISGVGVILYIVSAVLINYYLRKNRPDILNQADSKSANSRKGRKAKIIITQNANPGWVSFLSFLSMPMVIIGIGVIILSLIIKVLGRIF
jgi:hypothetical protein